MTGRESVAVLGTGSMGQGIAQRLARTGRIVRVWNRTPGRTATLTGVDHCPSSVEAVEGSDFVVTSLADDTALRQVLGGINGIADHLTAGQTVVNLGTVSPGTIRELEPLVSAAGAALLDVGMLGNAGHALEGELRLYVGGDPSQAHRALGLLHDLGKEVVHVGPLGSGMALKLVLNLVMGLEMQALAEAAGLGEALGLDREQVLDVIGGSGFASPVMRFKARRMTARAYDRPDFRLALMAKDLGHAATEARARGLALPMTAAACESHRQAVAEGRSDQDCASIAESVGRARVDSAGELR